ncbi:hypothetical protein AVEN_58680-1 [Araneus ventricosus]|uniref:Mos1 transposase HTH domain-containing protein n=1 Tax=Araneus ventricosus TaxID=182803 RepID=A0A4Y2NNT6_ARAVE|nr:hypothetical protein AVEN_58680-1 [Araneus ventricosus]
MEGAGGQVTIDNISRGHKLPYEIKIVEISVVVGAGELCQGFPPLRLYCRHGFRAPGKSDIHWQICEVYGATALCEGKVRKWVRDFKIGCDNIHDDSLSSHPSVITDNMVASVEVKILENRRFAISTLSSDFLEVSRSVLYKIVSEKLNFKKLCSRWVPKLLTQDHKNKRFECSLNFLIHYNEEGDTMLSQIVTGDETWVSHVTPESKQQSVEWRDTHSCKGQGLTDSVPAQDHGVHVLG